MTEAQPHCIKNAFTNNWLKKWQKNNWRTSDRKDVLNKDLWERLIELSKIHQIEWQWVRGHSDNDFNNRCDELVHIARDEF